MWWPGRDREAEARKLAARSAAVTRRSKVLREHVVSLLDDLDDLVGLLQTAVDDQTQHQQALDEEERQ